MSRIFDVYLAVDWSSRNGASPPRPVRDAIWFGEVVVNHTTGAHSIDDVYCRTRTACVQRIRERLVSHVNGGRKVLIGFDFPYGYPSGFAAAIGVPDGNPPWRGVWTEVSGLLVDDVENRNNRFDVAAELNRRCGGAVPGPFWGCPAGAQQPTLRSTSPPYPFTSATGELLQRLRWVDRREPRIQPVWKLFGNGSVGGQALVGIPALMRLRDDTVLARVSRVWPFETGFGPEPVPSEGPCILHAEIWPGIIRELRTESLIKDQAQVRATALLFSSLDSSGKLARLFDTPIGLPPAGVKAAVEEEGWILGAGAAGDHFPSDWIQQYLAL